ncbi:DUF4328 domain-containing protein [Streptomyces sp. NPDC059130]|uniref:DUF4328 domain-containing protein n=2 Tax=unclassified Streptomyces TaxID=2593676 RepID=UPI0036A6E41E
MLTSNKLPSLPPLPSQLRRTPRVLLVTVGGLLTAVAMTDLYKVYRGWQTYSLTPTNEGFSFVAQEELDSAHLAYNLANSIGSTAFFFCGIAFVVWFHRMRRNAGTFEPAAFRLGPGWAIGSWFFPFVNLVLPYLIARSIWSVGARPAAEGKVTTWPLHLWWGLFVGNTLLGGVSNYVYNAAESFEEQRDALVLAMTANASWIVAAAAAVYFVIRLTDTLDSKVAAAQPV